MNTNGSGESEGDCWPEDALDARLSPIGSPLEAKSTHDCLRKGDGRCTTLFRRTNAAGDRASAMSGTGTATFMATPRDACVLGDVVGLFEDGEVLPEGEDGPEAASLLKRPSVSVPS